MADPFAPTLLGVALVWLSAKAAGELALRLKLPSVVGELGAGIGLAWLCTEFSWIPRLGTDAALDSLANLGVVVLMFAVGLESTVPQMLKVGLASLRVALVGVVAPLGLGLLGAHVLLPGDTPFPVLLFIGACLSATSIGISAQVLREQGVLDSAEGRVIIGAAVIDDVLGLLLLVFVSGLAQVAGRGGGLPWGDLGRTLALAVGFLVVALSAGRWATPHLFRLANRLRSEQLLLPLALGFAFLLAWLGHLAGLAPIVGAYAAGLLLEPTHVEDLQARERHSLEDLLHPLVMVLAPVFFVVMGARVDVTALFHGPTLGLALALTGLGVAGKLLAGIAAGPGVRKAVVGWGMVPRGEVGLIFVAVGAQVTLHGQPLLSPPLQAAVVAALMLTTVIGPVALGRALRTAPD